MKKNFWGMMLLVLLSANVLWAQKNPNEAQLRSQIEGLKQQLVKIDTSVSQGDGKGRFSSAASDSLYKMQDYLMDLNDRLYWLTNKDSLLNAPTDRETPREDEIGMDGKSPQIDNESDTIPMPKGQPDFDLGSLMPKPKVKKYAYYFQFQNGVSLLNGQTSGATPTTAIPEWASQLGTNFGGTFIYALRLGKADLSKLKMEFNIKKKLTTSNFLKASPWQLRIGLGLQRYSVRQKTDFEINRAEDKSPTFSSTLDAQNNKRAYDKNTLTLYYLHVPITIWRKLTTKTCLEVGCFVDYARKTTQTLNYRENGIEHSLARTGDFGVNDFAYGATAAIGSNATTVYVNYHFNSLFAKSSIYNYNLMSIGIKVGY
jgi:hypothetical protein